MGGFFNALFSGSNPSLNQDITQSQQQSQFGTQLGNKDVNAGSDFWNTILSGNPEAVTKLLSPEISTIQGQGQQQLNTAAQFGNRSGGTNAAAQTNIDSQRKQVQDLIAQLTGQAAGQVGQLGLSEQGLGLQANQVNAQESQDKLQNEQNSIFGKLLQDVVTTSANAAEGALGL